MPYEMPETLPEALRVLGTGAPRIVAGCTDFFPSLPPGARPDTILDISRVADCRGITHGDGGWRIGAAATWTDVLRADLPPAFDALRQSARTVGSVQIQNRATVVGNLCNASPAADGVPPLLILDAQVEIASLAGTRTVPLPAFITGVRSVDLARGEMATAILVPRVPATARSAFAKLGSRTHLVISIVMVSALIDLDEHARVTEARIAVGSCSPVAQRLPTLETRLRGMALRDVATMEIAADALAPLAPISDIRGSADYRIDVAAELCRRAILQTAQGA